MYGELLEGMNEVTIFGYQFRFLQNGPNHCSLNTQLQSGVKEKAQESPGELLKAQTHQSHSLWDSD